VPHFDLTDIAANIKLLHEKIANFHQPPAQQNSQSFELQEFQTKIESSLLHQES